MAEEDKEKVKSSDYTEATFKLDMGRLAKAPSEKDRMLIVKTIANNYLLSGAHAAAFVHELREWNNQVAVATLLLYNLLEGEEEAYQTQVVKQCKYEDDKKEMAEMMDTIYVKEKEKEKTGPKINTYDERNDRYYRFD